MGPVPLGMARLMVGQLGARDHLPASLHLLEGSLASQQPTFTMTLYRGCQNMY